MGQLFLVSKVLRLTFHGFQEGFRLILRLAFVAESVLDHLLGPCLRAPLNAEGSRANCIESVPLLRVGIHGILLVRRFVFNTQ